MSRRRCADASKLRLSLALCCALAGGCSVFEAPLQSVSDGGDKAPVNGKDAGDEPPRDASDDEEDAGRDAGPAEDTDAAGSDAGSDASTDAAVEPPEEIPQRPATLAACGFGTPTSSASVGAGSLDEISGMVASRKNANIFWVIEDSGGGPSVHAINSSGVLVATYRVAGTAVDYEDIAIGPGPDPSKDYLYVADIGDNEGNRSTIIAYRAPEPTVLADQTAINDSLVSVEPLPMKYPKGPSNAESLFVDPVNSDIYVVTKDGFTRPNTVYRLPGPHQATVVRELEKIVPVFAGVGLDIAITAADISPDGKHIMIRSLRSLSHWTRAPGVSIADTLIGTTPCDALLGTENKGESVTLTNAGYYTVSEGLGTPLYYAPFTP